MRLKCKNKEFDLFLYLEFTEALMTYIIEEVILKTNIKFSL